ncbi:hypothetical protein PHK61_27780 [Actinomycetospora lutea]|uniref:hypothetical protein n=1 Tax=Actinomycetospora lutea TaxID=663604 RepID=UPI0023661D1D|nr:hypothetical protein [Actinomycetospora lutea]MDD7942220.1 hypothetical protein [Actinomycetospora lutea]
MTAPTAPLAPAPWLLSHATACAEAVATALDLLDGDDVETVPDTAGAGFTLWVHADPPREVRALRWSATDGWAVTRDPALRRAPRWRPLALPADAEPLVLCEVLRGGA